MPATDHQLAEARRRLALVEALPRYPSLRRAAEALGEPVANLCRYRRAYQNAGHTLDSLLPEAAGVGRPALAALLSDSEIAFARRALLATESLPLALEELADSPACSHPVREMLNRYRERRDYPPSVVQAVRFTDEQWAAFRGKKHEQNSAYNTRRGMWVVQPDGSRREIVSGDIVEADDISLDTPYYVRLPDGSVRVCRQVLVFRDLRSAKYLYAAPIARSQDSYRAEDIVRACRWLIEAHGLPGRFRFERGSWASDPVDGYRLPDGTRWGGVAQVVPITHAFSSNGKAIEGGFRLLHKALGLQGVRIGKTRGEYEAPTADMLAVNAGRKDPAACGFIAWEKLLPALEATFTRLNGRSRWDRHTSTHTTPDDLWVGDLQARPGKRLPVCPPEFFDHFLPVRRQVSVGAVQGGHVQVSLPDHAAPFLFRCAGLDPVSGLEIPYLERGHKVWVAFDPHECAATGAIVYNAEPSDASRNRGGYRPRERLFTAPLAADRPQLDLRPAGERGVDADVQAKKLRTAQVRAAGTSIGAFGVGARRVQQSSDAQGNVSRIETGAPARSHAPRVDAAPAVQPPRTESGHSSLVTRHSSLPPAPARAVVFEDLDAAPPSLPATRHSPLVTRHSAAPSRAAAAPAIHYEEI